MAWEKRRNGRSYFYQKRRSADGRVASVYVGRGPLADLTSQLDASERQNRTIARLALRELKGRIQRIDGAIVEYRRQVRGLVADTLQRAGFYRHKGQWRLRRREKRNMANELAEKATLDEAIEYRDLMMAAEGKGKGEALKNLRNFAQKHPDLFARISVLATTTLTGIINSCAQDDVTRIHLEGEVAALKRSLGIDVATPLERLLIDDLCVCWMRMHAMEQTYSAHYASSNGVTHATGLYLERRLSATRRRYLQSLEALARVRRLLSRVGVQVNIAQQQIVNR